MPIPSCPPEIKQIMIDPVVWEPFLGFDGHAEPSYGPALTLYCFQEAFGTMSADGGIAAIRGPNGTVVVPYWDLFFDGDNEDAREFQLYDRFTPAGIGSSPAQQLQAIRINTMFGPPFDSKRPWLVVVTV